MSYLLLKVNGEKNIPKIEMEKKKNSKIKGISLFYLFVLLNLKI